MLDQPPSPGKSVTARSLVALGLTLYLGLFLVDGLSSLADESLRWWAESAAWGGPRLVLSGMTALAGLGVYALMAVTPWIPKRRFVPLALFHPLTMLLLLPLAIVWLDRLQQVTWWLALGQLACGLVVARLCLGGWRFRWPMVAAAEVAGRFFTWRNTLGFLAVNVFLVVPLAAAGFVASLALAVRVGSDGFLQLTPRGLNVRACTYTREDGKHVQLIPMIHVGDASFYRELSESFPEEALILMEGVQDSRNLLTNRISYARMAHAAGLAEQAEFFRPSGPQAVSADVDVEVFSAETLGVLNLVMLLHANGFNARTLEHLSQFVAPPGFERRVMDDLLTLRNRHLLGEIEGRLVEAQHLVVPWGAAHIPEIARELERLGFVPGPSEEFTAIQFGGKRSPRPPAPAN